ESLHAPLDTVDERRERREAADERLIETVAAAGAFVLSARQRGIVGGVDDELALLVVGSVGARKGDASMSVEHLEVLGVQTGRDRARGQGSGDVLTCAAYGESGVTVDDADRLLVDGETLAGQLDEQRLLVGPGFVGHPA